MKQPDRSTYIKNMTYAAMAGQSGCASSALVIGALVLGLALDSVVGTKPLFTLALMLLSIPLSLVMMLYMVLGATRRITPPPTSAHHKRSTTEDDR